MNLKDLKEVQKLLVKSPEQANVAKGHALLLGAKHEALRVFEAAAVIFVFLESNKTLELDHRHHDVNHIQEIGERKHVRLLILVILNSTDLRLHRHQKLEGIVKLSDGE